MSIAERFGRNLNQARKGAGFSQEALAVRASIHRTEVGLLERGERTPRIDTVIKLAGALGVPFSELIAGIEWSPGSTERGTFTTSSRRERRAETMRRAAAFRERQSEPSDVVELVREGREELERKGRQ